MAKRKRQTNGEAAAISTAAPSKKIKASSTSTSPIHIQIITGSYDRVLHGITATISPTQPVKFTDTFLLESHTSAVRCLALSPPSIPIPKQPQKIILATGSTDERISLYHLSAHPPSLPGISIPSFTSKPIVEDPSNREFGSLLHHSSSLTALHFLTRSKLLSSAEDSTIAVTRTRDWTLLSSIKAPIPKVEGRPSGDTAQLGTAPSGINDFAVHPSMKLMISVGKGEKCMRLWNLVTGKKAGVLGFEREHLIGIWEGKYSSGEGRKVSWGQTEEGGDEFCVGFERGVLVFGMDSRVRCKVVTMERTKIHKIRYVRVKEEDDQVLAISTEDGRMLFYSTTAEDMIAAEKVEGKDTPLPSAKLVAQVGGKAAGLSGRVKDFTVLNLEDSSMVIAAGSSDGTVRLWKLSASDLEASSESEKQVGILLGTYQTSSRITCLGAFVMVPRAEGVEDLANGEVEEDVVDVDELEDEESSSDSSDE